MADGAARIPSQREPEPAGIGPEMRLDRRPLPQIGLLKIPRQVRAIETVHTVLDAAVRVLALEGAGAFHTNRIAAVAGVSPGSLYQYFANREMILAALAERCALQVESVVRRALAARRDLPLEAALRSALDTLAGEAERHGAVLAEVLDLAPLPAQHDLTAMLEARLAGALRAHLAGRPVSFPARGGPAPLFAGVSGCLSALLRWAVERPPHVSRAALVDALAAMLAAALQAGAPADAELASALP